MTQLNRVTDLCRNVLMQGKGLRPVLRYTRRSPVNYVRVDHSVAPGQTGRQYAVTFYFDDRAQCLTYWSDIEVLLDWLASRRSWGIDRVRFADTAHDLFEAHGGSIAARRLRDRGTLVLGSVMR